MDKIGLILLSFCPVMIFNSICITVIGLAFRYDPLYYIFHANFPGFETSYTFWFIVVLFARLIWAGNCVLEGGRIFVTVFPTWIIFCNSYFMCVSHIRKRRLSQQALQFYHQLHCINQIGMYIIRNTAAVLLAFGLVFLVLLNWAVVASWKILEKEVYFLAVVFEIISCCIIDRILSLAIKSNESSVILLQTWTKSITGRYNRRYVSRAVKAEKPLAIYYAMTNFEKSTRFNYYSVIVNYTVTLLLAKT